MNPGYIVMSKGYRQDKIFFSAINITKGIVLRGSVMKRKIDFIDSIAAPYDMNI